MKSSYTFLKVRHTILVVVLWQSVAAVVHSQVIDFEFLPGGAPTTDNQVISNEYEADFGVTFMLLDRTTGLPNGSPRIAKVGAPRTAFYGCGDGSDNPAPGQDVGSSFLTDDGEIIGADSDLLISYTSPVEAASGVLLDLDCTTQPNQCEQWTITARDAMGMTLDTLVISALLGANPGDCTSGSPAGPGNGKTVSWLFNLPGQQISSILIKYTGSSPNVGVAFDNLSPFMLPGPPMAVITSNYPAICEGESAMLTAQPMGGLPPFTYQWQQEATPGNWTNLGTALTQPVSPTETTHYRVIVSDVRALSEMSAPFELVVSTEDVCSARLLITSNANNRVLRYRELTGAFVDTFVPSGSGSLASPGDLAFGPDGALYVGSQANNSIKRYDSTTGAFLSTFVATGAGGLNNPGGIIFGGDCRLYVSSTSTNKVLRYDAHTGEYQGEFVTAGLGGLSSPRGIAFGPDGHMYVASLTNDRVLKYHGLTGAYLGDFVTTGSGGINNPKGLVFGPDGNLYVAGEVSDNVVRYDGITGAPIDTFVPAGSGGLNQANDLAFGPDGNLYVVSSLTHQILRYNGTTGAFMNVFASGNGLSTPAWLVFQPNVPCAFAAEDTNCDAAVDTSDIPSFVGALLGVSSRCSICWADANGDGCINGLDINDFVDSVLGI